MKVGPPPFPQRKILKHVVRKCHINSTYPSTAHMLSCVQLDILQSGVQQHEEGVGQQKRIYNNERNENEESQIAQKLPICVSRGCLELAITIFSSFTTIHVLKFFNFKMLYGT